MTKHVGLLKRAVLLLSKKRWQDAVREINEILNRDVLPNKMALGAALAMKAEGLEKMGRVEEAATVLCQACEADVAASVQFAQLVIRANLEKYYREAWQAIERLFESRGSDPLAQVIAEGLLPLRAELERRCRSAESPHRKCPHQG